jgi:hypothetical protein
MVARNFTRNNVPVFQCRRSCQEACRLLVSWHYRFSFHRFSFHDASRCSALRSGGRSSRIRGDAPYFQWRATGASSLTFSNNASSRASSRSLMAHRDICCSCARAAGIRAKRTSTKIYEYASYVARATFGHGRPVAILGCRRSMPEVPSSSRISSTIVRQRVPKDESP